jgi:hypothetical protein
MDASARANDLIDVASRLIAVMEREIAILRDMRIRELREIQPEKDRLAGSYLAHSQALGDEPGQLGVVAPAVRQELRDTLRRFHRLVGENERALRAARDANDSMIKAVVGAVVEARGDATTYTKAGTIRRLTTSDRAGPTPLSIDRQL